jgi:eukaryotic-like serine/threonine-protein kinase
MCTPSQIEAIFFAALEKTAAERSGYLDCACGEDSELRRRVERLLEAFPQAADFLARPAVERPAAPSHENGSAWTATPPLGQVGDYRILREIGRGGMGVVYEAEQITLGRRVALKVLPRQVSRDPMVLERFRREARAAARLHHTNIVPVFEVGQEGNVHFYAMQFIQGLGLEAVITEMRRLRDRAGSQSKMNAAAVGQRLRPSGEHSGQGIETATLGEGVEVSAVLQYILTGRFDTVDRGPEPVEASPSMLARALAGGLETQAETESRGTKCNHALAWTEPENEKADKSVGPQRAHRPEPALSSSASTSSGSAILPGGTQLSSVESSRRALFRSLAQIGRQVAGGLAYAHARGIVHRDIKPSNLLLDTEGVVWIADFGLAKGEDEGLTHTGDILGTIRYMAPERFRGEGDARADVYALGMTLYELLTLRPGFDSRDRFELTEQIKTEEPRKPRTIDARIPRDLETIVLKAIEKDPKSRYQTAESMGEDLRRFLADEPIRARQVGVVERYWRWAGRNRAIALLGGVLIGVLVLATMFSLLLAGSREAARKGAELARSEEAAARLKSDEANIRLRATEENLRRTVYATRSNLALAAWDAADVGRLRSLLDLLRPAPGEPDLRGWEWRYLWQLAHEDRLTLRAQVDRFADVAFSPDGQTLAGLEGKGRIQLWDRHTGELRLTTGVMTQARRADLGGGVGAIAFSPDGRSLAGPGPDASLALYAVDTGLLTLRFEGPPEAVLKLAWSPDGRTLVAGLAKHRMRVWDARDGHLIQNFFGAHDGPVAAVAFGPNGLTIVSGSYDHTVKLWSPEDRVHPRAVLKGHTDEVHAVAFSPDGRRVASAGRDRTLRLWDPRSGAELAVIRGHTGLVTSLAYLPDGARVVTASADQTVRIWDIGSAQELRNFKGTDDLGAVAVSPDGRDIAAASRDETVRVWDASSPPRPHTLQSPSVLTYGGDVECLAFSPDGRRLVSGHDDDALRVWELPSGRPLHLIKGHTRGIKGIKCVAFSPDGQTIVSGGQDSTVRLWDAATGQPRIAFTGHTQMVLGLVFTPDGQTVLSGSSDGTIQAWDAAIGVVRYVLRGHSEGIDSLAISPDGHTLASASSDKTCILWDLPGGRPRATLRGHTGTISAVAFSSDGRTLATASYDHTVRLWDAAAGSPQGVLDGHIGRVDSLAFSPDGRLASAAQDKTIRLWDPASGQTLLILKGHAGRIRCIKFSPDGRTLASASYDRTLKLWEAAPVAALAAPDAQGTKQDRTE